MVLSRKKLKRKGREERAANGESVVANPESTTAAAAVAPDLTPDSSAVAAESTKKKKKEKMNKKRKVDISGETDVLPEASSAEAVQASKKMEVKKKKKKKREANSNVLEEEVAGVAQLANGTEDAVSNGLHEAEQVGAADPPGASAHEAHEPSMSVREKKGKKKKSGRDRWGEKIADEPQAEENSLNIEASNGARPQSDSSSGDIYDPKKVFVGGMPYYTTEDDIHNYFSECGVISALDCMTFEDSGNFRGIAFITFTTDAAATKSLEYDGADMGGRFLKIDRCKVKPQGKRNAERGEVQKTPGSLSAYIGNLSYDIDEESIRQFFKKSYSDCKIESMRFSHDKDTGDFRGFGHIDFGDDESLEAAVKLNQTPLLGRPLKIAYAVPTREGHGGKRNDESDARRVGNCYSCGQGGHKAFLCPNKGASGNQRPDGVKVAACYSCGQEGHKSFMCPSKSAA